MGLAYLHQLGWLTWGEWPCHVSPVWVVSIHRRLTRTSVVRSSADQTETSTAHSGEATDGFQANMAKILLQAGGCFTDPLDITWS